MRIFFHAPLKQQETDDYHKYYQYIADLGHEHVIDFSIKYKTGDLAEDQLRDNAQLIHRQNEIALKRADVVVLGATEQSLGVGYFLSLATKLSKPIIALCKNREEVPFFYEAIDYNKLMIVECTENNYKTILPESLHEAQRLVDKRFTLLLPPDVVEMLDTHYHKSGQTRSDYIRDLIREDQTKEN